MIDLDPSYPLNLAYTKEGLEVELAFQGQVTRCLFGWLSIYAIIDRSTGRGIVVESHLPPAELDAALLWVEKPKSAPKNGRKASPLRALSPSGSKGEKPKADVEVEAPVKEEPAVARVTSLADRRKSKPVVESAAKVLESLSGSIEETPKEPPKADDAKARRARFRVIDGGQ